MQRRVNTLFPLLISFANPKNRAYARFDYEKNASAFFEYQQPGVHAASVIHQDGKQSLFVSFSSTNNHLKISHGPLSLSSRKIIDPSPPLEIFQETPLPKFFMGSPLKKITGVPSHHNHKGLPPKKSLHSHERTGAQNFVSRKGTLKFFVRPPLQIFHEAPSQKILSGGRSIVS